MTAITSLTARIQTHHAQLEAQLEQIYNDALQALQTQTHDRLCRLEGEMTRWRRAEDEIKNLESFWSYVMQAGGETVLVNWARHLELRREVQSRSEGNTEIGIYPDLKVAVFAGWLLKYQIAGTLAIAVDGNMHAMGSALSEALSASPASNRTPSPAKKYPPIPPTSNV
jgi:hypothetical protein